jgi:hypothetical protein
MPLEIPVEERLGYVQKITTGSVSKGDRSKTGRSAGHPSFCPRERFGIVSVVVLRRVKFGNDRRLNS